MKIALCTNYFSPSVGGAEIVTQTIAEYLSKHHKIAVFTRRLSVARRNPTNFDYPIFEYRPGDIVLFDKQLKSYEPDVLLIYSDVFDFFREITIKKQPFKLVLALCGANWLSAHRNHVNIIYRNASNIHAFICHSKYERDYRICSSDRIVDKTLIIPNGVWTEEFDKNKISRQELAPDIANKRWILNVSNFFPGKGQEHLIDILNNLTEPENTAYIQICRDIDFSIGKQLEARWRHRISKLKEKEMTVKLMKNIDREQVIGFLKQSNVFAFSSEKEVAPLVLLESMAASLPWVSTNVGNAEELAGGVCIGSIKDSRYHTVFNQYSKSLFIKGLENIWNDSSIGEKGRKQIDEKFHWNKILPQYLMVVEK